MTATRRARARRARLAAGLAVAVCVAVSACSLEPELPEVRGAPGAGDGDHVCTLLTVEEVEVAVNAPLDTLVGTAPARAPGQTPSADAAALEEGAADGGQAPPGAGVGDLRPAAAILPGMQACSVSGERDGAAASWALLKTDAETAFDRYRDWHGEWVEDVRVDGHAGVWDARLRTLVVLAGDQLFALALVVPDPPVGDEEEQRAETVTAQATSPPDARSAGEGADARDSEDDDEDNTQDEEAATEDDDPVSPAARAYIREQARELAARAVGRL